MRSFVNATLIAQRLCSPNRDGQELLPQLVNKLITASISKEVIRDFRFPHGDQIYLHGPDGILAVDDSVQNIHIPAGISLWEMGTSMEPRAKAEADFLTAERKLADAFPGVIPTVTPDQATFVFVASKPWDSVNWIKEKRIASQWKSIKVIDAVQLETWLEQCPAVMLWFADVCGLPAEGLYDAEQYLRKLAIGYGLETLSPDLVVAGRDEQEKDLLKRVLDNEGEIQVYGESVEESAAFLAAASLRDGDHYSQAPPFVFADGRVNLNLLATSNTEMTIIPLDTEAMARIKALKDRKWRLIIPDIESIAPHNRTRGCLSIGPCKRAAVEQCLVRTMTLPDHRARQIARDSKGSFTALLWLVGSGPLGIPRWASRKDATTHASLILAGSWIGNNPNDIKILERLSGKVYRDVETLLQSAQLPDGPWIHRGTEWLCGSKQFVWSRLVHKVTETMLDDFRAVTCEVIGEEDPSLELPRSKRHMAAILGKSRLYSSSLRKGLVDSIARLAIFRADGEAWADRIVRDLLDPEHPRAFERWYSLSDVFSEMAEASPRVFLDCLDRMLLQEDSTRFFQDRASNDDILSSTSKHVYLLWALERLAWQPQYFSRVLMSLARMAAIDPGGNENNSPMNSLVTILLPWSPQHSEPLPETGDALRMLYSTDPNVTWDVCIRLLPTLHGCTFPTPTPQYRQHAGRCKVTNGEYWDFIRTLVGYMVKWAGHEVKRWVNMVEAFPEIQRNCPDIGTLITDGLANFDLTGMGEEDKSLVHNAIKALLARHNKYSDADWALSKSDLGPLTQILVKFKPTDAVLEHCDLFSWDPEIPDAPMRQYEEGWDEWIDQRRQNAADAVYRQDGVVGLFRLAERVVMPDCVGQCAANLQLIHTDVVTLFERGLCADPGSAGALVNTARAYVWRKYREGGDAWLEELLKSKEISWTPEIYANIALGLPASTKVWEKVESWGVEASTMFWKNVGIPAIYETHWARILEKWKEVQRPWSSLALIGRLVDGRRDSGGHPTPSAEEVANVLEQVLQADESIEPDHRQGSMLLHYVEAAFLYLDSQGFDSGKLARLEWGWLRILENTKRGARVLREQVTASPELFVELLKAMFRAEGDEQEAAPLKKELAEQAWHLLRGIKKIPGCRVDETGTTVDPIALRDWVIKVRELAGKEGRLRVCDSQVGEILSFSPSSPDESWPCQEVRDLIEELHSTGLENGLCIGKLNQRGAIFRGKGGKQEWDLAEKYRQLADMVRVRWPRTASILDSLTKHYESDARLWDEQDHWSDYE